MSSQPETELELNSMSILPQSFLPLLCYCALDGHVKPVNVQSMRKKKHAKNLTLELLD